MKKLIKTIFLAIFLLLLSSKVHASSINSITMDIYIDSNGNANVTEVWDCKPTSGTEAYHPYYNLGNSKITNLTVSENGIEYTSLNKWNTSGTLDSKKNKCGINKISNGVELCWGIGSYSSHKYTVKYTITNFVSALTDSQMVYWTLIPQNMSDSIGRAYIKIYSNFNIPSTTDVWGYGNYGGTAYVYNGYIEMESDGRLSTNEYMTILVKFPTGTFNTSNKLNNDFNYYYNMAEEGSTAYVDEYSGNVFTSVLSYIVTYLIVYMLPIFIPMFIIARKGHIDNFDSVIISDYWKKNKNGLDYYRDIPCNKDIFKAYYVGYKYKIIKNKTDLLGAVLLKWIKEGKCSSEKRLVGKFRPKEETCIILQENITFDTDFEKKLHSMLYEASGDGVLEKKELEKWCNRRYTRFFTWFSDILSQEKSYLINEEKIISQESKSLGVLTLKKFYTTKELDEEAMKLKALKKYLLDYTLIKDREAIEVHLFDEYLMYAQLLGIAAKVAKQFKDLYPELIEQSSYDYNDVIFIHSFSQSGVNSATTARARAQSYSGGGRRVFFWRWPEVDLLVVAGGGGRRIPLN